VNHSELLTLTRPAGSGIEAQVRYAGARDLSNITGSPVRSSETHEKVHDTILERLTTFGKSEAGNELPVDLTNT
jgi:hypothetical protein